MNYHGDSGFAGRTRLPTRADPSDWMVWHFTHLDNLAPILEQGGLGGDASAPTVARVTRDSIKSRRTTVLVRPHDDPHYPRATVSQHVPWYFAPRSPTLFCVVNGYGVDYTGGAGPLVMFGMNLGDLARSDRTWCYSDRNAAEGLVRFGRSPADLPDFIDFDLMTKFAWKESPDDRDRPARRAAEVLVLDRVPLSLITELLVCTDRTLSVVSAMLRETEAATPWNPRLSNRPWFFYQ